MTTDFDVQDIPRPAPAKPRVIAPQKDDLVKQVKMTGARYKRIRCSVTVRPEVAMVAVAGGYVLPPGTHEVVLDEHELASLMDMLETQPEEIAAAKKAYHKHLVELVDKKRNGHEWRDKGIDDAAVIDELKRADKETGESISSFFFRRTGRSILPLTAVEQLGELAPLEMDTDANPAVVGAIAAGVAREIVTEMRAQSQPQQSQPSQQGNNHKR